MGQPLRVLIVEDNPVDAELILRQLRRAGFEPDSVRVDSEQEYLAQLEGQPEVILSDFVLPGFDGARALELLKERGLEIPFLIISGTIGEDLAVQVMKQGATDYLLKDRLARLGAAVAHAVEEAKIRREVRRATCELAESESRLSRLAASAPGAIFTFRLRPDRSAHFAYASPRFEDILGLAPAEVGADALRALGVVDPEDVRPLCASIDASRKELSPWSHTFRILHPSRGVLWIEGRATPAAEADGVVVWHGFLVDVTDRKQLEEQLRQAQKMEAIGQLAGGVAHDFNNLLTVILGHASLLMQPGLGDDEVGGHAQEIEQAAERAAALTRQLLLFSRKQVMQPVNLDLNAVVGNVSKMLQRLLGEDITLTTDLAPDLPLVRADAGMMEQVLLNLAVNSRDAMPDGGLLTISTRVDPDGALRTAHDPAAGPGPAVCITVKDSGCGIPPELIPRVFEPFFTTKEVGKGTGLGLATVYGIVQQHRGWLDLESEAGRGATFRIGLPAVAARSTQAQSPPVSGPLPRGSETILVVEDEPALRSLVAGLLQRLGYRVMTAPSGVAALEVWHDQGGDIDLVLTDMLMPDGMTGGQLACRLLADRPELKVVFTSGYSADLVAEGLELVEGINYLQKPYDSKRVAQTLRSLLDAPPPPQAGGSGGPGGGEREAAVGDPEGDEGQRHHSEA